MEKRNGGEKMRRTRRKWRSEKLYLHLLSKLCVGHPVLLRLLHALSPLWRTFGMFHSWRWWIQLHTKWSVSFVSCTRKILLPSPANPDKGSKQIFSSIRTWIPPQANTHVHTTRTHPKSHPHPHSLPKQHQSSHTHTTTLLRTKDKNRHKSAHAHTYTQRQNTCTVLPHKVVQCRSLRCSLVAHSGVRVLSDWGLPSNSSDLPAIYIFIIGNIHGQHSCFKGMTGKVERWKGERKRKKRGEKKKERRRGEEERGEWDSHLET